MLDPLTNERELHIDFDASVKYTRARSLSQLFAKSINTKENGFAIRINSLGWKIGSLPPKPLHLVLGVWYPADEDEKAPLPISLVRSRFKAFLKSKNELAAVIKNEADATYTIGRYKKLTTQELSARKNFLESANVHHAKK